LCDIIARKVSYNFILLSLEEQISVRENKGKILQKEKAKADNRQTSKR